MARRRAPAQHGSFAIAGTFVGTVIGAGFASGQETLRFFTAYGPAAWAGLALSTGLFAVAAVRLLVMGAAAPSQRALLAALFGRRLGALLDGVLVFVLLIMSVGMASGGASALAEQFGWPRWVGAALITGLSAVTVMRGLRGVVAAVASIAPVLVAAVWLVSVGSLAAGWEGAASGAVRQLAAGVGAALCWPGDVRLAAAPTWWEAAVLYVAYNVLLTVPALAPLGAAARPEAARRGGVAGAVGLGVGAVAIHLAVAARMPAAAAHDVPILAAAQALPPWVTDLYGVLLLAEIYTTSATLLFGFAARLAEKRPAVFRPAVLAGALIAFAGGQLPFGVVVGKVYPVVGVAGLALLLRLLLIRPRRPVWPV